MTLPRPSTVLPAYREIQAVVVFNNGRRIASMFSSFRARNVAAATARAPVMPSGVVRNGRHLIGQKKHLFERLGRIGAAAHPHRRTVSHAVVRYAFSAAQPRFETAAVACQRPVSAELDETLDREQRQVGRILRGIQKRTANGKRQNRIVGASAIGGKKVEPRLNRHPEVALRSVRRKICKLKPRSPTIAPSNPDSPKNAPHSSGKLHGAPFTPSLRNDPFRIAKAMPNE